MTSHETRLRTFARALTWRVFGVALTVLLTWFLAGDLHLGLELGIAYNSIRLVTHYFHDRFWAGLAWGLLPSPGDSRPSPAGQTQTAEVTGP